MSTYTYTYAYTRAQALVDQVSVLFSEAGISESATAKVCHGVRERWLDSVGLYLERNGGRVYEVEARIKWSAHLEMAELEFSTDLPGWEGKGSPEALILGRRFAGVADRETLAPYYWVLFTSAIRADPARHQRLCPLVGVSYASSVPDWAKSPTIHSLPMQDLREVGLSERSAL
ncbi:hypothetical protein [Mycobacterium deserti]|uniref:Uncharacterized protein n=1 Tax=Mycobacterium deserti TaxID=2978347 RepID=A0ABT2M707_9MYCO|nr:hypothetical protein [Mycobacterium deserti]MCT7658048.1 hypothetical protein [Mycobacterium deserti]